MRRINKWAFIIIMLFFSCKTRNIIPEKDMVSILVKMNITDAVVISSDLRQTYFQKDTIDYYSKMIQSYGYSFAQFDSSLKYYSKEPKALDAIYDKVIIELSKIETKLTAENLIHRDSINQDSLKNLWNLKNAFTLPTDEIPNTIDFDIKTVGLGVYTISADVLIYYDDESVNPSLTAYFYSDDKSNDGNQSSVTSISYNKSVKPQNYSIKMELHNSLVTNLKGSIFSYNNSKKRFYKHNNTKLKIHAEVSNIKIFYKPLKAKSTKPKKIKKQLQNEIVE